MSCPFNCSFACGGHHNIDVTTEFSSLLSIFEDVISGMPNFRRSLQMHSHVGRVCNQKCAGGPGWGLMLTPAPPATSLSSCRKQRNPGQQSLCRSRMPGKVRGGHCSEAGCRAGCQVRAFLPPRGADSVPFMGSAGPSRVKAGKPEEPSLDSQDKKATQAPGSTGGSPRAHRDLRS